MHAFQEMVGIPIPSVFSDSILYKVKDLACSNRLAQPSI